MITVCPSCSRQFRITAGLLSAAKGLVQCGFCGKQFNALDRLFDQPQPPTKLTESVKTRVRDQDHPEPEFVIPAQTSDQDHTEHRQVADELAVALLQPEPVAASRVSSALWFGGLLLLVVTILMQMVWFNRDSILSQYPQYLPVAKQLCERLHCQLIRQHYISSIVVLNRDVRDHPAFYNVLLVNVTIENQADQVQPYPLIQLTLFDTEGRMTGYRQFRPGEYLAENMDIDQGMTPSRPLHLVLEVTGSTDNAVSFEIRFL